MIEEMPQERLVRNYLQRKRFIKEVQAADQGKDGLKILLTVICVEVNYCIYGHLLLRRNLIHYLQNIFTDATRIVSSATNMV